MVGLVRVGLAQLRARAAIVAIVAIVQRGSVRIALGKANVARGQVAPRPALGCRCLRRKARILGRADRLANTQPRRVGLPVARQAECARARRGSARRCPSGDRRVPKCRRLAPCARNSALRCPPAQWRWMLRRRLGWPWANDPRAAVAVECAPDRRQVLVSRSNRRYGTQRSRGFLPARRLVLALGPAQRLKTLRHRTPWGCSWRVRRVAGLMVPRKRWPARMPARPGCARIVPAPRSARARDARTAACWYLAHQTRWRR